jgi:hypothetical protein
VHAAQSFLVAIFQDQGYGVGQAGAALLQCAALAVGTRDLGALADLPVAIALDYHREFIPHGLFS